MRSSKSRSRSKNNRNRSNTLGNVVNRVFDSSGPEGKVRGTPQQIIDKYNQLARDAWLANDRVAAENFQQHAEHYLRMLAEAQREQDAKREQQERENRERQAQQERENRERQAQRDRERAEREAQQGDRQPFDGNDGGRQDQGGQPSDQDARQGNRRGDESFEVRGEETEGGLVETPESASTEDKPRKPRAPRKPRRKPDEGGQNQPDQGQSDQGQGDQERAGQDQADQGRGDDEAPRPKPRRTRKPAARKDGDEQTRAPADNAASDAAE
ncbi:DUF4167 domain-containing protein [Citreimonas salinaria]|uniref:DUF4167 domain-containing protein n=1 Tax=Citreimonas salinaria TaxID=321339 RepID=A0A1H3H064_9RHOB|nr:DUF4167 domain-containing protein [Citreimonas salinaria]SDY08926.1 protein of unknown function [Citreimonas salinaria]